MFYYPNQFCFVFFFIKIVKLPHLFSYHFLCFPYPINNVLYLQFQTHKKGKTILHFTPSFSLGSLTCSCQFLFPDHRKSLLYPRGFVHYMDKSLRAVCLTYVLSLALASTIPHQSVTMKNNLKDLRQVSNLISQRLIGFIFPLSYLFDGNEMSNVLKE